MKKKLLILFALCLSLAGHAQTFTDTFITYTVTSTTNNTVEITGYDTAGGTAVTIPETVTNNSITYSVTSISNFTFQNKGLTSAIIGDNVIFIGSQAFVGNQLNSLVLGNSVTTIGFLAFGNNSLMSLNIPVSVTDILDRAFEFNSISSVTIPANVTDIGLGAFRFNPLTCITSEATTPPTIITGGTNDTFASNRSNMDLSIPSGTANAYTAAQWTGFKSVAEGLTGTFTVNNITYQINPNPNNEVTITDYNTAGGTAVIIPAAVNSGCTVFSVKIIGPSAFISKALTSVDIPDSVTTIEGQAFLNNSLMSVTIPDSVTNIGANTFNNNQLMTVDFGDSITTIGGFAFISNQLTSVTIPSSVVSIGGGAFSSNLLTDVYSESTTPPAITTGTNDSFGNNRSTIHLHIPAGTMDIYVTNPNAGADWSGFNPVTEDVLSISDFELANNIKVISTSDKVQVISPDNVRLENYTIYSMSGAKLKEGTESTIAIDAMASGIYIIELNFDRGRLAKKIIIN